MLLFATNMLRLSFMLPGGQWTASPILLVTAILLAHSHSKYYLRYSAHALSPIELAKATINLNLISVKYIFCVSEKIDQIAMTMVTRSEFRGYPATFAFV